MTWLTTCAREGCARQPQVRGYCRSHYAVARKQGKFQIPPRLTREERFWSKVQKTETCWLWAGAIHYSGYPHFNPTPKQTVRAHRFAYELVVGPIPTGLTLDHLCRVRHCVNPDHLEPVTAAENARRAVRPTGPNLARRQTACARGHSDWATTTRPDGTEKRLCRTCRNNRMSNRDRRAEYELRDAERSQDFWPTVRRWARENGIQVAARGPLSRQVINAYLQATGDKA